MKKISLCAAALVCGLLSTEASAGDESGWKKRAVY
jgi:hypothetical protein